MILRVVVMYGGEDERNVAMQESEDSSRRGPAEDPDVPTRLSIVVDRNARLEVVLRFCVARQPYFMRKGAGYFIF